MRFRLLRNGNQFLLAGHCSQPGLSPSGRKPGSIWRDDGPLYRAGLRRDQRSRQSDLRLSALHLERP
jgi:hypothetical protein